MENLSMKYTYKINKYLKKDGLELEKIRLGIEILLINISKFSIVMALGWMLNLLPFTLIIMGSFSFIRRNAFGLHAKSSIICTIITTVMFVGGAYISKYVLLNNYMVIALMVVIIPSLYKYAPADTDLRPILGQKLRKKLKKEALLSACILFLLALIINNRSIKTLIILGTLFECISINPLIYKIFGRGYKNYEKYEREFM